MIMGFKQKRDPVAYDCELIVEAIRRLRDGTWNLQEEDFDYTFLLFPRIRSGLRDHIHYEEEKVLPFLSKKERREHNRDHQKMTSLLWAAEQALKDGQALHFQSILDNLIGVLENHHHKFSPHTEDGKKSTCCPSCDSEEMIFSRFKKLALEL